MPTAPAPALQCPHARHFTCMLSLWIVATQGIICYHPFSPLEKGGDNSEGSGHLPQVMVVCVVLGGAARGLQEKEEPLERRAGQAPERWAGRCSCGADKVKAAQDEYFSPGRNQGKGG